MTMPQITNDLNHILERLRTNDIAAIPTETVYGLAADAESETGIHKVFTTKQRPLNHPLIMHILPTWDLTAWVSYIPDYAYALMSAFWPGPLTLIFALKPGAISPLVTGGQASIALRAPNHALTQTLLQQLGKPLVAPSANPFGKISPTTALHVKDSFPHDDFLILDGGRCSVGVESTIISALAPEGYQLLRHGVINSQQITAISKPSIAPPASIRAPGLLATHYQPEKKVFYVKDFSQINHFIAKHTLPYVLTFSKNWPTAKSIAYQFPDNADVAAYELYYRLRIADQSNAACILIELPPERIEWMAIREKIQKAGTLWK